MPAGAEFDRLQPSQQAEAAEGLVVFSRVEPLHKLRLVEILRQQVGGGRLVEILWQQVCVCRGWGGVVGKRVGGTASGRLVAISHTLAVRPIHPTPPPIHPAGSSGGHDRGRRE